MQQKKPSNTSFDLSIVIPALREEKRIGKTLDELARFLKKDPFMKTKSVEVLVVSADSPDKTHQIVRSKKTKFKHLTLLKPGPKVGKGRDVQYGMLRAKGQAVMFMDADLATPLRHIPKFYRSYQKGNDVVIGTRNLLKHHPKYARRLLSNSGNMLFRLVSGIWVEDSQCGFKLFSKEACKVCFSKLTIMGWGFDMEVLAIAKANKFKIASFRINDWVSVPDSKFTENILKNSLVSLQELSKILLNRFSGRYVQKDSNYFKQDAIVRVMPKKNTPKRDLKLMVLLPLALYFVFFAIFTWPWITHFNNWFFTDGGDGLQNVWNMWWVNKSVTQLGQLPWHTNYLHAPWGVTLLGQTLNPFNGFVGIFLQRFMSLNQAFNVMIILSFILAGLFMFWLCYYFTKSYVASLIGGAIFTFSSYHFAHAIGHMQLVSLEFIPLFILLWWRLITKPNYKLAVGASAVLLLVLLCDYYYFLYSLITASFIFIYFLINKKIPRPSNKEYWLPMLVFGLSSLILVAPIPFALLTYNRKDELLGSHPARLFSTDLFSPLIDGGFWRFHSLTYRYWSHIKAFVSESSVYLGLGVITTVVIAIWKRAKIHKDVVFWLLVGAFFGIMSLGPRLMIHGRTLEHVRMPYVIMERVVPGMQLSGVPVRMMVMVTFAAAIIAAMVLAKVNAKERKGQLILAGFVLLLVVEMFPSTLPLTPVIQPKYVYALHNLPSSGSVLDNAAISESYQLYHQTTSEKPMVFGYISRMPKSVQDKEWPLFVEIDQKQYDKLCSDYGLRYITTPVTRKLDTTLPIVYQDDQAIIYDLKNSPHC